MKAVTLDPIAGPSGYRRHLLLPAFEALRRADLAPWAGTSEVERARVGIHAERGPESLDRSFRLIAGHDQARRALAAVRGA
ncbi:MAG: hypothetical protein ACE14W_00505 [Candidatus Velamenicoccus archaeovorus]